MATIRRYAFIACCLVPLAACAAPARELKIGSTPTAAEVRATADQKGPRDFFLGQTPFTHTFVFGSSADSGPTMYNLEFKKPGYEPKTVAVRRDDTSPAVEVTLDREVVKEVEKFVIVVSDDKGYTVERRTVRAWIEDIEREGMAASSLVRLGDNQSVVGMSVAPDGHMLYFALAEQLKDERGNNKVTANIRAITTDGGGITQVTSGQWLDSNPTTSGNGQFLVFNSNRIQIDKPDLFRIATAKTGGIAVIRQTWEGANFQPSAARDGVIAFTYKPRYQGRLAGEPQVWTIGGEAGYPTQLRGGSMPAVSPSGNDIAFIGDDKQLWVMPVSGQNPIQLTSEAINKDGKRNPSWSADGKYILFASEVGKDGRNIPNYDIWMIPAAGGVPRQLTTNGSDDDYPVVSPDQKYIYFVSNRGFREGIWRIPFPKME